MFETLANRLEAIFKKLRGHGKLNEANIQEALREVRLALLEADVHFKVVKNFIDKVREKAVGQEVLQSLTPGQQVVKIVHEELLSLMGGTQSRLTLASQPPTIIMLVGLQGSGKTTLSAKLAKRLKKEGHRPFLIPADIRRPAAIDQLETLGKQIDVPVFEAHGSNDVIKICREAVIEGERKGYDLLIIDTAGRLHIDQELMEELRAMKKEVVPHEILFVADAMTGQNAVSIATAFHEALDLDGFVLTKMDGDARGGAALSIRAVIGKPIKFITTGETLDHLEPFHPDRMASRILGMGDILSLIEKAEESFTAEKARELERKIREDSFTLEDFREQLRQIRKMGPLEELLNMIPGIGKVKDIQVDEKELVKIEAMINSMTPKERANFLMIDGSRRRRIAKGSGTTVQDVNRLLKQFLQMRRMMAQLAPKGKKAKKMNRKFFPRFR